MTLQVSWLTISSGNGRLSFVEQQGTEIGFRVEASDFRNWKFGQESRLEGFSVGGPSL